jgi:hypothetical protein
MTLPAFTVTGNLSQLLGITDVELPSGVQVTFTCNNPTTVPITYDGALYQVLPLPATFDVNGDLMDPSTGNPVELLANDPGLNVSGLQWNISVVGRGGVQLLAPWWFNALTNGETLELAAVAPAGAANVFPSDAGMNWYDISNLPADLAYTDTAQTLTNKTIDAAHNTLLNVTGTDSSKQPLLTETAVKTSAYTAAANQLVPCNATGGAFTVTLPTAPAEGSRVVVKKIDSSANAVTVACGGSDVFNVAAGSTTGTLTLLNQAMQLQYDQATAIWYVISTDVPLSQLDARYVQWVGGTVGELPATSGQHLTTQGGNTLDDGSGHVAIIGGTLDGVTIGATTGCVDQR